MKVAKKLRRRRPGRRSPPAHPACHRHGGRRLRRLVDVTCGADDRPGRLLDARRRSTRTHRARASRRPTTGGRRLQRTRSAPRATSRGRSRPASRPTSSTSSIEPDMQALVDAGIVADDWDQDNYNGIVQDSVVVFVVRKGNPKNIQTWDDLVTERRRGRHPEPVQLGGREVEPDGRLRRGSSNRASPRRRRWTFLQQMLEHTAVQDGAASDALTAFTGGKGDVLLSYESEAIEAQDAGEDVDYVDPRRHDPDRDAGRDHRRRVRRRRRTSSTTCARRRRSSSGRTAATGRWTSRSWPRTRTSSRRRRACSRSTTSAAGRRSTTEFFDPENGIVAEIERNLGVATG